ncbi:hypothetical protein CHLRE_03g157501v5 [Chlamydomonas reinhardtii]|uniref:Uncharacterized protein n=1 Tax=Chlamydomonas reinhardtii TaxID=3055 RepID=A0A2K3DW47_CHLRE|nr:uncharacterized protein CHLRE_03g157501v5 [Chlamydomonas reinhardtii]PNW84758.1 hypothetical protein CHLRE_03g157501v5 [Chlamydomonas reinhardtii]
MFFGDAFRLAWHQFEARLDRCHVVTCPICQLSPRKLICDGTAVTYQIVHYCGVALTTLAPVAASSSEGVGGSSRSNGSGGGAGAVSTPAQTAAGARRRRAVPC